MSRAKKNYERKSKQKSLLGLDDTTAVTKGAKGDIKNTLIQTGKSVILGVGTGLLTGVVLGRTSLAVGLAVMGASYYYGSHTGVMFGAGMITANGYQKATGAINGTADQMDGLEGVKERLLNFRDSFSEKLWLDKILKKKSADKPANGLGQVQYFTYPGQESLPVEGVGEIDLSALDKIEQQIKQQAQKQAQPVSGNQPEDTFGALELEDKLY
ncbi:MAG: hypothetical protein EWV91_07055 [Microcystis aeruginosa Ma_QC_Ca_00000000_S207]|uniref:Uncharacterized protein n=1 Tax=Microcystis aeruginosa Ma_QC_Ca_00000000_S207 TaxID=2486251 RepID=A0A552FSW7_MICAE|nr:MAG: hypothetical protein EWV91_07055 [Microcystis aeruginosa Ma_QC_Ca_00000000_S207]